MHERTLKLRQIMARRELTARDVARVLGCSETTVRIWRCKNATRIIPANTLRLLELEVERAA